MKAFIIGSITGIITVAVVIGGAVLWEGRQPDESIITIDVTQDPPVVIMSSDDFEIRTDSPQLDRMEETIDAIGKCLLAVGEAQLIDSRKIKEMHAIICFEPETITPLTHPTVFFDPNDVDTTTDTLEDIQ